MWMYSGSVTLHKTLGGRRMTMTLLAKCNTYKVGPLHSHSGLEISDSDLSLNVNLQHINYNYPRYASESVETSVNVK